jgi:hypothetical protein
MEKLEYMKTQAADGRQISCFICWECRSCFSAKKVESYDCTEDYECPECGENLVVVTVEFEK